MARRTSRIIGKNLQPLLDEQGLPQFGTLTRETPPTKQQERRAETRKRVYTVAEHAAFLTLIGHQAYLIPGTPERTEMLRRWIDTAHPVEAQDYRQLERWQKELIQCQAMQKSHS